MDHNKITLGNLYSFSFGKKSILKSNLCRDKESFYKELLPYDLFQILFPDNRRSQGQKNSPTHSRTANGSDASKKYFKDVYERFEANQTNWEHHISNYWTKILHSIVPGSDSDSSSDFHSQIKDFFFEDEYLKECPLLCKRLEYLLKHGSSQGYEAVFTCLTLLASTRFFWGASGFIDLLLPLERFHSGTSSVLTKEEHSYARGLRDLKEGRTEDAIVQLSGVLSVKDNTLKGKAHYHLSEAYCALYQKEKSQSSLKKIRDHLFDACRLKNPDALMVCARELCRKTGEILSYDPAQSCWHCLDVVHLIPRAEERLLGEAYYILYQYSQSGLFTPPPGDTVIHYLKRSAECGYAKAVEAWNIRSQFSLVVQPKPSKELLSGRCILNTGNRRAALFQSTVPDNWEVILDEDLAISPARYLNPMQPQKYLFLHENLEKNLNDTLNLLQAIKDNGSIADTPDITIYLRGEEEQLSPVIDTALNHIKDTIIPVHILDDKKWAAQRLLSLHPLFYPVYISPESQTTLHFIVLGSGKRSQWLVREAFWRMSMLQSETLQTKITVLAENAPKFLTELSESCSGLDSHSAFMEGHGDLRKHFPVIQCKSVSDSFFETLRSILKHEKEQYYFAIDTDNDLKNLNLAIRLREWTIQTHVFSNAETEPTALPVIAFQCEEPNTAHLSRSTVVQLADHGNAWYNNYHLIPFGCLDQRYTWKEIDGGVLERMSYCIHMSYNDVKPEERLDRPDISCAARKSYYSRQYNRDSSYCTASSIPYLLFRANYPDTPPIVPPHWDILDEEAFLSEKNRSYFIQQLHGMPKIDDSMQKVYTTSNATVTRWTEYGPYTSETRRLARLEHIRWCAWMLSRGWLPVSAAQAQTYMRLNQNKQQLYVAKLHPCICTSEELEKLEKVLKKNFFQYDYRNIQLTEDFLALRWLM